MKTKKIALVIFIHIFALGISSAEIYKWVDENGITHYSDSPTEDIPGSTETDEIQSVDPTPADTPPLADESQKGAPDSDIFDILDETQDQEEQVAADTPTVEIYETTWCGYCKKAKDFFRSKGIDFVTYDIEQDQQARSRMKSLTSRMAVPFVVINGQGIPGYSVAEYEKALRN